MTAEGPGVPNGDEFQKLEAALVRAGKDIAYPPVPPVHARVRTQLAAEQNRRERNWLPGRSNPARWAGVALAALLLSLALLIVFPDTREALAQLFGLRTVRILFITPPPTGAVTPQPTSSPTPTLKPSVLCCETTLAEAQTYARFKILLPTETPSRVYFQELPNIPDAQQVVLVFGDPQSPRWTLYEATNIVYGKLVFMYEKSAALGTVLAETTVNGQRALWLSGAPHILVYLDAQGQPVVGTERPVNADTLAWEQGDITFRLETKLSQEEAVRLAESLR